MRNRQWKTLTKGEGERANVWLQGQFLDIGAGIVGEGQRWPARMTTENLPRAISHKSTA